MESSETKNQNSRGRPENYRFGKLIGEGSFSTVYLAKCIDSKKEYAIKVCQKKLILKEKKQEYVKREKTALHLLSNTPGICNLSCTFQDTTRLYFVLSYAKNGDLLRFLKHGPLSLECAKFYGAELLLAIEQIHKKNIIHRDLKPENLLLNRGMHLMIADFGSSKLLPNDYDYDLAQEEIDKSRPEESNDSDDCEPDEVIQRRPKRRASFVGTAQYVSPEILKGNASHLSTDLWAFGCIIYQMLTGYPPFRAGSEYLIFQKITSCDYTFPEDFNEDAKDLVKKLLKFDPKTRIGSNDLNEVRYCTIRKHKFFEGTKWERLRENTPPEIKIPSKSSNESDEEIGEDIEPGLCSRRENILLLQGDFVDSQEVQRNSTNDETSNDHHSFDEEWREFIEEKEKIVKKGFMFKKKGLFARKRFFLLTDKPRLIYIDVTNPKQKLVKGEIPFSSELKTETKNFKIFFIHTPGRRYDLEDIESSADSWCEEILKAKERYILGKGKLEGFQN